jgi:hypothetical protein
MLEPEAKWFQTLEVYLHLHSAVQIAALIVRQVEERFIRSRGHR